VKELNISSFIRIMRAGFIKHDGQEAAGVFLLEAINEQDYVKENGYYSSSLGSKKISNIVNYKSPVPDEIQQASVIPEVIDGVIKYFKEKIVTDLNPHLKEDTLGKLIKLIDIDPHISSGKREQLLCFYESGDAARFLAEVFLYVVNRPNKEDEDIDYRDAPLLLETSFECPICHKKLVETVKDKAVKRYVITHIFPTDLEPENAMEFEKAYPKPSRLDSQDNLIALDADCAESYMLAPTLDEYKRLREIKSELARSYAVKSKINSIELEDDIRVVIDALIDIQDGSKLINLEYNALRIDEKLDSKDFMLRMETQHNVVTYYRYIESIFSESDANFDLIASEIQTVSAKFEDAGMSQGQVINQLAEWIRNQRQLDADKSMACRIVVAFFIQNCEVFHK